MINHIQIRVSSIFLSILLWLSYLSDWHNWRSHAWNSLQSSHTIHIACFFFDLQQSWLSILFKSPMMNLSCTVFCLRRKSSGASCSRYSSALNPRRHPIRRRRNRRRHSSRCTLVVIELSSPEILKTFSLQNIRRRLIRGGHIIATHFLLKCLVDTSKLWSHCISQIREVLCLIIQIIAFVVLRLWGLAGFIFIRKSLYYSPETTVYFFSDKRVGLILFIEMTWLPMVSVQHHCVTHIN